MSEFGEERIALIPPSPRQRKHRLVRSVWTDQGVTNFWDEQALDYKTIKGSWAEVETLGYFDSREDAREFMIARKNA